MKRLLKRIWNWWYNLEFSKTIHFTLEGYELTALIVVLVLIFYAVFLGDKWIHQL